MIDRRHWIANVGLTLLAGYVFVLPLPGTIALRLVLLLSALGIYVYLNWGRGRPDDPPRLQALRVPLLLYAGLTLWLLVCGLFVAVDSRWALQEFRSQWLVPMASLLLGILAARAGSFGDRKAPETLLTAIASVWLLQVLAVDVVAMTTWVRTGTVPFTNVGVINDKTTMSFLANMLVVMIIAEYLRRWTFPASPPLLRYTGPWMVFAFIACAICLFVSGARNGVIGFAFLVIAALFAYAIQKRSALRPGRILALALPVIGGLTAYLYVAVQSDPRWHLFVATLPYAFDPSTFGALLDGGATLPRLPDGRTVDASTYLRVASFVEAARIALESPLGVGFGRNAFGQALQVRYGTGQSFHSDSSVIDFLVGAGFPGIVLRVACLLWLIARGLRQYARDGNSFDLLLVLLASGFFVRMIIDSVTKNHFFLLFMLVIGAVVVLAERCRHRSIDAHLLSD